MTIAAAAAFSSCGKGAGGEKSDGQGVLINGVRWTESNVAAAGTFAAAPEDTGMFYQWNSKTAWPATGDMTGWNTMPATGDAWTSANDPCPAGWRVPTKNEQATLLDASKVESVWAAVNGVDGRRFTDRTSGKSIFIPAVGSRDKADGTFMGSLGFGFYWSATAVYTDEAWDLAFNEDDSRQSSNDRRMGFTVRCVKSK